MYSEYNLRLNVRIRRKERTGGKGSDVKIAVYVLVYIPVKRSPISNDLMTDKRAVRKRYVRILDEL